MWIDGDYSGNYRKHGYSVYGTMFAYAKSRRPKASYEHLSAVTYRLINEFVSDNFLKIDDGRMV